MRLCLLRPNEIWIRDMGKKILLVDDDEVLRDSLAEQLQLHNEFELTGVSTAKQGLDLLGKEDFDCILLEFGSPDFHGLEACRSIRRSGIKSPIVMLTASGTERVLGIDAGANDCIVKPFRFGVLLAWIRAELRLYEHSDGAAFSIGPYTLKPSAKILVEDATEKKVRLTEKEAAIMKFLYYTGNQIVSRETLLVEVWGYHSGVTTHTLETHVYRLRQKIELNPSEAEILVTEAGGYRLVL